MTFKPLVNCPIQPSGTTIRRNLFLGLDNTSKLTGDIVQTSFSTSRPEQRRLFPDRLRQCAQDSTFLSLPLNLRLGRYQRP